VEAHVEENWTGSRLTNTEKEGVERSEERGYGGRVIKGRGTKCKGAGREGGGQGGQEEGSGGGRTGA